MFEVRCGYLSRASKYGTSCEVTVFDDKRRSFQFSTTNDEVAVEGSDKSDKLARIYTRFVVYETLDDLFRPLLLGVLLQRLSKEL